MLNYSVQRLTNQNIDKKGYTFIFISPNGGSIQTIRYDTKGGWSDSQKIILIIEEQNIIPDQNGGEKNISKTSINIQ